GEDADGEGGRGMCRVGGKAEMEPGLGREETALFGRRYGVTPAGNWEGVNVLCRAESVAQVAAAAGLTEEETAVRLESARARLLAARGRRGRPQRGDKGVAA